MDSSFTAKRNFEGRVALVTGGASGIGYAVARQLAELGAKIAIADALAPGAIETWLVARMHSAETCRVYRAGIPLDRYGTPDETAFCAVFLASEQAGYIAGHILGIGLLGHTL